MSSTNRRFISSYLLLVGLPLAALAGVLKAGRTLTAPISIDGTWKVETNASLPTSQPCDKAVASLLGSSVVISQSGKSLELTFAGASRAAAGKLEARSISASLSAPSGCRNDQTLTFLASVENEPKAKSLTGSLSASNCPSCAPTEFRAQRQPKSQSGAAR